jgi:hypothetical protein
MFWMLLPHIMDDYVSCRRCNRSFPTSACFLVDEFDEWDFEDVRLLGCAELLRLPCDCDLDEWEAFLHPVVRMPNA